MEYDTGLFYMYMHEYLIRIKILFVLKPTCVSFSLFQCVVNKKIVNVHADCSYSVQLGILIFDMTEIPFWELFHFFYLNDYTLDGNSSIGMFDAIIYLK